MKYKTFDDIVDGTPSKRVYKYSRKEISKMLKEINIDDLSFMVLELATKESIPNHNHLTVNELWNCPDCVKYLRCISTDSSVSLPNIKNKASRSSKKNSGFCSHTTEVRPKTNYAQIGEPQKKIKSEVTVTKGDGKWYTFDGTTFKEIKLPHTPPQPKKIKPIPDNIVSLELLGEKVAEIIDYLNSMEENK